MSTSQSRHVYTAQQRAALEASFVRQSHPDMHEKERLAKLLNCNLIQICNWFQNHRRRVKKQQHSMASNARSHQIDAPHQVEQPACCYCYYSPSEYGYPSSACAMTYDPFMTYYEL